MKLSEGIARLARACKGGIAADCTQLGSLARNKGEGSSWAVRELTNLAVLTEIAGDASQDKHSRQAAVESELMKDQAVLAEVARGAAVGADMQYLAEAAVKKLFDQPALEAVAKTAKEDSVASKAIDRLTDRKALEDIAASATQISRQLWARQRIGELGSTTVTGVLGRRGHGQTAGGISVLAGASAGDHRCRGTLPLGEREGRRVGAPKLRRHPSGTGR